MRKRYAVTARSGPNKRSNTRRGRTTPMADDEWWQDPQFRCEVCGQPIVGNEDGRCGDCIDGVTA